MAKLTNSKTLIGNGRSNTFGLVACSISYFCQVHFHIQISVLAICLTGSGLHQYSYQVVIVLQADGSDCLAPLASPERPAAWSSSPPLLIFLLQVIDWKRNELFIGCKGNKLLF